MNPDGKDHLREMMAVFNAGAGLNLPMTPFRERMLRMLHRRGFGAADVTAVLQELKRLARVKPQLYDESSLEFGKAVANVDKFQDRAETLRKRAKAKAATKRPAVKCASAQQLSPEEDARIRADAKTRAAALRRQLSGGPQP